MNKIKWGILSTAKIGVKNVIPAMQKGKYSEVTAIASRTKKKAEDAAADLNIPIAYGSYEELLADPEIEAIYNPLPNHMHVPWTIKALEAGKNVLCEKPIALSYEEAHYVLNETKKYPDLKVMEAFMYRFHPQWDQVKNWIKDGKIGELRTMHSEFTYFNDDPGDIRNKPEMGGGGLMDIGCYCISASRYLFNKEPAMVFGEIEYHPTFRVDYLASGILKFTNGSATFTCSTQLSPEQRMKIFGTHGFIEMSIPFNPLENPAKVTLVNEDETIAEEIFTANHYTLQGDAFSKAILENLPIPTSLDDAVANMKVIDALFASSEKQCQIYVNSV